MPSIHDCAKRCPPRVIPFGTVDATGLQTRLLAKVRRSASKARQVRLSAVRGVLEEHNLAAPRMPQIRNCRNLPTSVILGSVVGAGMGSASTIMNQHVARPEAFRHPWCGWHS